MTNPLNVYIQWLSTFNTTYISMSVKVGILYPLDVQTAPSHKDRLLPNSTNNIAFEPKTN